MAGIAASVRQLAYHLYADESLVQKRGSGRVFEHLQREKILQIKLEVLSIDSTAVKVHPDGTGALKKTALSPSASPEGVGPAKFIWLPRMLERL